MRTFPSLIPADLQTHPVWTWTDDETPDVDLADESGVRPASLLENPEAGFRQFLVACNISLKDGSIMPGIAEVTLSNTDLLTNHAETATDSALAASVLIQPCVVFMMDRQLTIPAMETNRLLSRYTKFAGNHPCGWQLEVCLPGESAPRRGDIAGADLADMVNAGLQTLLALRRPG